MNQMDRKNYKYQPQFAVGNVGQYAYFHDEDESQFTLVDQSKVVKTAYQKKIKSIQNVNFLIKICQLILSFYHHTFWILLEKHAQGPVSAVSETKQQSDA